MRRLLPLLALALVPLSAGTSSAATCTAVAMPPSPSFQGVTGKGSFRCTEPRAGMTVTVCVEVLDVFGGSVAWEPWACETATAPADTDSVSAGATMRMPLSALLAIRTTASGGNDAGDTGYAESPPVVWFNCGCPV